jgi:uncharacterized protein YndB with AHSA1/START domain
LEKPKKDKKKLETKMSFLRNAWTLAFGVVLSVALVTQFVNHVPANYRVVRSTVINASPAVVFKHIADFNQWPNWSPWAKLDASAKMGVHGAAQSVGHKQTWDGPEAGTGEQTIVEVKPNRYMRTQLNFTAPFAASPTSEFVLRDAGDGKTAVEWDLRDTNALSTRIVMTLLFINMEAMLGAEYDQGLRDLKALCERQ